MNKLLLFMITFLVAASCQLIKYNHDIAFIPSAQANSMEMLLRVNGKECVDMDGIVGLCAKRVADNSKLKFTQEKRPYSYRFTLRCSSWVSHIEFGGSKTPAEFSVDVPRDTELEFYIYSEDVDGTGYTCVGETFPDDREESISAKWKVSVTIFDHKYNARENIWFTTNKGRDYIIFGEHALYSTMFGSTYKKATCRKIKNKPTFAYSESYQMRFNYWIKK
jgi:hypothetical protein